MDFNHYYRDLMGVYGYENRKWKMDGPKLTRVSEAGEDLYFYDLPDFNKSGLIAWFKGLNGFNLVQNKNLVQLSLYERWKLYSLIEMKFNEIQRLNKVKGQIISASSTLGKGIVTVGRGILNPAESLADAYTNITRDSKFEDVRKGWREHSVNEHEKAMNNATPNKTSTSEHLKSYNKRMLEDQLKVQQALESRGEYNERFSFEDRMKMRAKAILDNSISREELDKTRQVGIQDRITNLENRFNNGG